MEMRMYYGQDEGDDEKVDTKSPGGIVVESVSNIRTVASLNLEENHATTYRHALENEDGTSMMTNLIKGSMAGMGSFMQMWGTGLMFF